jgi:hypothetical protein
LQISPAKARVSREASAPEGVEEKGAVAKGLSEGMPTYFVLQVPSSFLVAT